MPNGLIGNIFGPVGKYKIKWKQIFLVDWWSQPDRLILFSYCLRRVHLQAPFRQGRLTPQMQAYNDAMSEVQVSVEWLFGDIINSVKFLDYKKKFEDWTQQCGKDVRGMCTASKCRHLPF